MYNKLRLYWTKTKIWRFRTGRAVGKFINSWILTVRRVTVDSPKTRFWPLSNQETNWTQTTRPNNKLSDLADMHAKPYEDCAAQLGEWSLRWVAFYKNNPSYKLSFNWPLLFLSNLHHSCWGIPNDRSYQHLGCCKNGGNIRSLGSLLQQGYGQQFFRPWNNLYGAQTLIDPRFQAKSSDLGSFRWLVYQAMGRLRHLVQPTPVLWKWRHQF